MQAAALIVFSLFIAAVACVVAGVHLLVGLPWALIAVGVALFFAAFVLRSGLTPNG
jgi:hypothetical protein